MLEAGVPGQGARKTQGGRSTFYCPPASAEPQSSERMEQAMAYETIIVETKGRVGLVRLNRPPR